MAPHNITQPPGSILELAFVVDNLEQAAIRWVDTARAGPFFLIEHLEIVNALYHNEPGNIDVSIALGFSGSLCVELIQQHDSAPSIFRDFTPQSDGGFHHWGITTREFDQDITRYEQSGYPLVFSGAVAVGGRFAFMDTSRQMHGMVELIELTPLVQDLFAGIEAGSKNWDGNEPIRRFT